MKQTNRVCTFLLSAGTLAGMLTVGVAQDKMASTAKLTATDRQFVMKAAMGGMLEVSAGKLAQQKGKSESVKQFGAHMVEDHTKANDELKQVASEKNVTLPKALDAKHQKMLASLNRLSGAAFDKAYISAMVADHREDVAEFSKASKTCKDPDVKGFATKTLPTLQSHYKMIQSLAQGKMTGMSHAGMSHSK